MQKVELLAPAGNFECLVAAVQSGADAVYISGKSYGARSFADNFDSEELVSAVDYCHLRGVCVYVTVNTLVYDDELSAAEEYLIYLSRIGVDALIVQDLGIIETAKKVIPDMPLHASTQMTIHNSYGVKALEKMGVKRIVLSRELSYEEIKSISKKTKAELEIFSHGALCMCYSGQCLMSSIIGGRSGNRGKCAQPCRLPYSVKEDKKKAFYMSLKDLCGLEYIEKLNEIGVASLKIEGRMKGPLYVAAVVRIYRKYIDNPQSVSDEDFEILDRIFNRGGLTDGYLSGDIGTEMFAFDKPDNPYKKGNNEIIKSLNINEETENRKLKLFCSVNICEGEFPVICVKYGETKVEYKYEKVVERAVKQPLSVESVQMRLAKTGGTPFEFETIDVNLSANAFMTAGDINAMRRGVLERFELEYVNLFRRDKSFEYGKAEDGNAIETETGFVCEITNAWQFEKVKAFPFIRFYVPIDIVCDNEELFSKFKHKIALVFPSILHEGELEKYCGIAEKLIKKGFLGIVPSNIDLVDYFQGENIYTGFRLNVFNGRAIKFLAEKGVSAVELSPELSLKKIKRINKGIPVQAMVYGRLPLMITENCVIKNGGRCPCNGDGYIKDRLGMKFPIIRDGKSCRNVILNCKKTFMSDKMKDIKNAGISMYRIYFTDEDGDECVRICETFFGKSDYCPEDYTRAHFYKGAE